MLEAKFGYSRYLAINTDKNYVIFWLYKHIQIFLHGSKVKD